MEITREKMVTVEYTLTDDKGEVLDTSRNRAPLSYIQGMGGMIAGFESALEGKKEGDKFAFDVSPKDGYGEHDASLLFSVPKDRFAEGENLTPGMRFQVQTPNGAAIMAVHQINDDSVVLDANHPLAGATLHFDVEVMGVRKATDEEIMQATSVGSGCGCSCDSSSSCDSGGCGGSCG